MTKKSSLTGIEKAVQEAGGVRALARLTGIQRTQISRMLARGLVSPVHCQAISFKTGVPLHELNHEIYPKAA